MTAHMDIASYVKSHTIPAAPELVHDEGDHDLRCLACANRCYIAEGERGTCRVRHNRDGKLWVPGNYVSGLNVDPIEKKPFYHVEPGAEALSFGMVGCNLHCYFCQNWICSQALRESYAGPMPHQISAEEVIRVALRERAQYIVSTYNEPLITTEWAVTLFQLARAEGIKCGYVSNGHASPDVLEYLRPYIDIYNVDLKCFNDDNYRKLGGRLDAVTATIQRLHDLGVWVEVVSLIVPGFNNSEDEIRQMAEFVASVSVDIPWHITAFHPDYHSHDERATNPEDLEQAYNAGKKAGLNYVYAGNLPGFVGDRENTVCPGCGHALVLRRGFYIIDNRMRAGACPECGQQIPGIWGNGAHPTSGAGRPRPVA